LNLGCGHRKLDGWMNVDADALCAPDAVVDLERVPWPWPDDSVEEVLLSHVLEHLGATVSGYLAIVKELYRVCRDGARVTIVVPHPRHDSFLGDPTHVRAITPESLALFSQERNREWIARGVANSPLGLSLGVDFSVDNVHYQLDDAWQRRFDAGELITADVHHAMRSYANVVLQMTITLHALKRRGAA